MFKSMERYSFVWRKINTMAKKITTKITCPYCNKAITLDEALTHPLEEKISKQLEKKYQQEVIKVKVELSKKDNEISELKKSAEQQIEEALKAQKEKIESDAKKKAESLIKKDITDLKEQVKEKDELLKKAEREELKLRKERRELEDDKGKFELEMQRKLDEERKEIFEKAEKKVEEEHELKDLERNKQIEDMKKQINELKRKAEQGSQKIQGEVLELELEQRLRENFVYDEIEPISSGIQGADILQKVFSKTGKLCGSVLLESKNAKKWSDSWVSKLKKDQRRIKADIGVIVTTVLPEGVNDFVCSEGIIIVHYHNVIPVIVLLRNQLFEITRTKTFNIDKNEKMQVMYQYLIGTEFRQKVEMVVEAFADMMKDLQKEQRAMARTWSKREKQIQQAFYGIAGMYGGMQGILGSSLPEIKSLELPEILPEKKEEKIEK